MTTYTIRIESSEPGDNFEPIVLALGDDLHVTMPPPDNPIAISHHEALIAARRDADALRERAYRAENDLANLRMEYDELAGRFTRGERP